MSDRVEGAGVALAYTVVGEGPAVVAVHDMGAGAAAGMTLLDGVAGRRIAYDRRGYGDSSAPVPYTATTIEEQAQDLAALITALDAAPALLVGDGFGALVVLDILRRHRALARAAVLADPPLHAFVAEGTEELSQQRSALELELRAGGPAAAVAQRAALADFAGLASWPGTRRDLRALDVPMVVVITLACSPVVAAEAREVVALAPAASLWRDGDVAAAARELAAAAPG
jgi:pimeloyl-ACP methyl ester carboxylesterase